MSFTYLKIWLACLFILMCSSLNFLFAQSPIEKAKSFIDNRQFDLAISTLNNRNTLKAPNAKFLIGVAYYETNDLNRSLSFFDELLEDEKNLFPEVWWYKGRILHARNQFEEALYWYKGYLKQLKDNHVQRQRVRNTIRACSNGIALKERTSYTVVENMGPSVNSPHDEFRPIPSPTRQNKLYFSTIRPSNTGGLMDRYGNRDDVYGKATSDMYVVTQVAGNWSDLEKMSYKLNSNLHEILLDFNIQGNALYYLKGSDITQGKVYIDSFQTVNSTISTTPFITSYNPSFGDIDPYIALDTVIYFASDRSGGYGGYDLYKCSKINGRWEEPINLGPDINTPYDERTPYLCNDRITLYYSSNNPSLSVGGLDVLKTVLIPDQGRWIPSTNVGLPINSSHDESHFRLGKDGYSGFFNSSRKDGFGERDIYVALFQSYLEENRPPENTYAMIEGTNSQNSNHRDFNQISNPKNFSTSTPYEDLSKKLILDYFNIDNELSDQLIDEVLAMVNQHSGIQLIITANVLTVPLLQKELNNGMVVAEKVANKFLAKGINQDRLTVRAVSNDFQESIIISFADPTRQIDNHNIVLQTDLLAKQTYRDFPYFGEVFFQVQISSNSKLSTNKKLTGNDEIILEKGTDGKSYKYLIGAYHTIAEANMALSGIKKGIQRDAFIIPYYQGMRITKDQAEFLSEFFPKLREFLNR